MYSLRGTARACHVGNLYARDTRRLAAVGRDDIDPRQKPGSKRPRRRRRRVQYHGHTRRGSHLGGILHRCHGHLQLHQHHVGTAYLIRRTVNVLTAESHIGPRGHHDRILALGIDRYERYARHSVAIHAYARGVDAVAAQRLKGLPPEHIIPDARHEDHMLAIPRRGHGLIGPFAAGVHHELAAENRLPRRGQVRRLDYHVGIAAAYYNDVFHLHTFYFSKIPFFRCTAKKRRGR